MNSRKHFIAVLTVPALLAAFAGCSVGPNYEPPKTEVAGAFTHTGAEGFSVTSRIDTEKPAELKWWGQLNDPVLDDLITRAVAANLDIRIATARVREARAQRGVVAADWFPQVDANASYERGRGSENGGFRGNNGGGPGQAGDLYTAGFDATWELDFFGRVGRSVEAADADIQAVIEDRRDVLVTLVSEVARNYVELRGFQQRLEIARKNIVAQKDTLALTQGRFKAGLTTDVDVAQAETNLAATEAQVPNFDAGVHQSIHRIAVLLGKPPTALTNELVVQKVIPSVPESVPVGLPSELLLRRPDVRRAEREAAAATARVGAATADLYPRFSITGSFGFQSDQIGDLPDSDSRFWSFGPAVRWPILDWGRIRANINVQDARTEASLARYEKAVLTSFEDVENALVSYSREQARRKSLATAVASSQRAFDLSNQLYSNGLTDFQRVLDSQRAVFSAEDALVVSDAAVAANLIALYKALGGGWEAAEGTTVAAESEKAANAPKSSPTRPLPPPASVFEKSEPKETQPDHDDRAAK